MTDWVSLSDAYGPATGIDALLFSVSSDPADPRWNELWSRLCHQGSIYSASYPAVAELVILAGTNGPRERIPFLHLAAGIVTSSDHRPAPFARNAIDPILPRLQELASESLSVRGLPPPEFIYLMQTNLAFQGESPWDTELELLADNAVVGCCPACETHMDMRFTGPEGCTLREGHASRPDTRRLGLVPATMLPGLGQWMVAMSLKAGQDEFAGAIPLLFGTGACPDCGAHFSVPDAIRLERFPG